MKVIYRVLILFVTFLSALFYFGANMKEKEFQIDQKTMQMREATLPYITMYVQEQEFNLLHGYCSGLDELTVRESITPISTDQQFGVIITENESDIRRLNYDVIEVVNGKTIEEGEINVLEKQDGYKLARITLKEPLVKETEYALKITLITNKSKRIYFYTRIKVLEQSYLKEKLEFVKSFHEATLRKDSSDEIEKYLEKPYRTASSFAEVTIHDKYDTVTYGTLAPKEVFQSVPTITEITKDTASMNINFILSVATNSGREHYSAYENYRFMYTNQRCYLYDYNRSMEAIFDIGLTSVSKNEFKLGITQDTKVVPYCNSDRTIVAFVRDHALWSYQVSDNSMTEVFSFYQNQTDYVRDNYNQHDIRILNMDEDGNIDFIVYGYMNRGEYEGRVGVILYRYNKVLKSVEEQVYLPMNTTYGIMKEYIGDFIYRNDYDVFYFHLFDTVYSYNLTSKQFRTLAKNVTKDQIAFSKSGGFLVYQGWDEQGQPKDIRVINLDNGYKSIIAQDNKQLKLQGLVDDSIIYGIVAEHVDLRDIDGTKLQPMDTVMIADRYGEIQKEYKKENYLITDVIVMENVIELKRIQLESDATRMFHDSEPDFILKPEKNIKEEIKVTKRVTQMMLTEYYLTMPTTVKMKSKPKEYRTQNVILSRDTTLRVEQPKDQNFYLAYAYSKVITVTDEAGEAIALADQYKGVVLDDRGRVIWERGAKTTKGEIDELETVNKGEGRTSLQACLQMMLTYKNSMAQGSSYDISKESVTEFLQDKMNANVIKAVGITLDEALYYIYRNSPVLTFLPSGEAILMTAYDSSSVTFYDPSMGRQRKVTMKEASAFFEKAENIFISFMN